jgi:Na+-translocating ferredoxin:NAD+ oxidoreductase subunit B
MSEDVYLKLRAFLDTLGSGYPTTPSGVEIRILKKLFSPAEAELTMQLKREPEKVSAIAARLGEEEKSLGDRLEEMAQKGLIYRVRKDGKPLYQAIQFIVGIWEFQLKTLDKELSQMIEEYIPYFGMSLMPIKTKQMRVIPVDSSLTGKTKVETYNRIRELVNGQTTFSVASCICRKEQGLLGKKCSRPLETCLGFGKFSEFYVENKMAKPISKAEALKLLDLAEESGLVLCPTNSEEPAGVCCCCPCCCPILKYSKLMPRPADMVLSYYEAKIDSELCSACGQCLERCQMAAIKEGADSSEIVDGRCIGCGLCVSVCPTEAISMVAKTGMEAPPRDFIQDTLKKIEAERLTSRPKAK